MAVRSVTRGIRNNNPGNIRVGDPWQGIMPRSKMTPAQSMEKEFVVFESPKWGIRALARVLIMYQDKHNLSTIRQIIGRWAPTVENDTDAYVMAVARSMKVEPDAHLSMHSFEQVKPLVKAIIKHENGVQPYDDDMIDAGLILAGLEPRVRKSVAETRTGKGSAVATVGTVGTVVAAASQARDVAVQARSIWDDVVNVGIWVAVVLVVAGIGYIVYARWDDIRKGLR